MKIENRDRLNNIKGIAHSIGVFTDQSEVADLACEMVETINRILDDEKPPMIKEEGK